MSKVQQKMTRYGNLINDVMGQVEQLQDKMSPQFEELRKAIDSDKVADIDDAHYEEIRKSFADGTKQYAILLGKFETADAPARFMGNHRLLTKAFARFVDGCTNMTASLGDNKQIDVPAFNAAEKLQDQESGELTKYLQRIQFIA